MSHSDSNFSMQGAATAPWRILPSDMGATVLDGRRLLWIEILLLLVLTTAPLIAGAPAKTSESKPVNKSVDKLVVAAQSALQQVKKNSTVDANDALSLGRHKGDSFTSPVDGYFIQVKWQSRSADLPSTELLRHW